MDLPFNIRHRHLEGSTSVRYRTLFFDHFQLIFFFFYLLQAIIIIFMNVVLMWHFFQCSVFSLCALLWFIEAGSPVWTDVAGRADWAGSKEGEGWGSWVNTGLFLRLVSLLVSCLSMEWQTRTEIAITQSYRRRQAGRKTHIDWIKWNESESSLAQKGYFLLLSQISIQEWGSVTETDFKNIIIVPKRDLTGM